MWICSRCQTANKDGYAQCVQCSAPRNARRFGAGTPLNAPSVQAASGERRMQQPESREEPSSPRRHPNAQPHMKARRAPGGPVRLVGILLAIARLVYGAQWAAEGIFTLFAILFVFVGLQFLAMGVTGEYIGRIYREVRKRPEYVIENIYCADGDQ